MLHGQFFCASRRLRVVSVRLTMISRQYSHPGKKFLGLVINDRQVGGRGQSVDHEGRQHPVIGCGPSKVKSGPIGELMSDYANLEVAQIIPDG